ncbi:MAG: hypothetical protein AAFY60_09895, partial [Myxococcota bacterium]
WFTYLLLFLLLTLPPITVWLLRPLWTAIRSAPWVSTPLVFFVVVHSLIPHKEERFMFAVLGLFFVLLASALQSVRGRPRRAFWTINGLALVLATFSDGNRAVATPMGEVSELGTIRDVVAVGRFYPPPLYLGLGVRLQRVRPEDFEHRLPQAANLKEGTTRFIFQKEPDARVNKALREANFQCSDLKTYPGDPIDQALVWLNREGNKRRLPRYVYDCVTKAPGSPAKE